MTEDTDNANEAEGSIDVDELRELADSPGTKEVLELYGETSGYSRSTSASRFHAPFGKKNRTVLSRNSE